ncbi:acyltransferase [Motiliproteus coralliicola]|uniref:Acyltransferase n=1 Tax=Motiliproteus coralliicola TaxID=2283196 RepID=A0A369WDA5_9GAMM|nr:acyltransferase family protein [Motiliproteus coralliicola]RDE19159.1 acyltransferase [Motiliproteus coralliicola]
MNHYKPTYRSEIDGLRALAVIPVILFHAGFELFSGGFVGVDVFFVISGYLITLILIEDIKNQQFSIIDFYERRARRILPALFLVMLVCIPFAWMWMHPVQMKDFSESLFTVSLFLSNFLFWSESGYFAATAEEKPLLHTWSLAVEEQYYLLFPIFLFLAWKFGRNKVFWMIIFMSILSLLLSEWAWRNKESANFYLAPTRAWELLAGSIAAFIVQNRGVKKNDTLSFLGLSIIVLSILTFDKSTPIPSVYALAPVAGVVMLILFAEKDTLAARILSNKAFVGIGLISYSAYLWHQPLFAFARIRTLESPSPQLMISLAILALVLAFISWKYVETPFRNNSLFSRRMIFSSSLGSILLFGSIGLSGHLTDGYQDLMLNYKYSPEEVTEARKVLSAMSYDMDNEMASDQCKLWAKNSNLLNTPDILNCSEKHGQAIVILGDSHAMNLFNIVSFSDSYPFVIGISQGGCRPHDNRANCHYDDFDEFLSKNKPIIKSIIFHQSGSYFIKDSSGKVDSQRAFIGEFDSFEDRNIIKVKNYLNEVSSKYEINVVWVGPFLEYRWKPQKKFFTNELNTVNPESILLFEQLEINIDSLLTDQEQFQYKAYNTIFYEPTIAFENDCFMFRDRDHYSRCGERIISSNFTNKILNERLLDNN